MPLGKTNTRMLTGTEFDQWNSSYTTVKAQSASNASVYSTVKAQSASNASVYTTVNSNSGSWGGGSASPNDANLVIGLSLFL